MKKTFFFSSAKRAEGQGVVEYAGALVIAAVLVSAVLSNIYPWMMSFFDDVMTAALEMISSYAPTE